MDNAITSIIPKVSICMVTFNRDDFIVEAIEGVLSQSFTNWELIIIDDASTDKTGTIVRKYSEKDNRIKYFKNSTNLGIVESRNVSLRKSKADYIAILDSDDVWCNNEKLTLQYKELQKTDTVLVGTQTIMIDSEGKKIKDLQSPTSDHEIRKSILVKNPFVHSSVMYNRSVAIELGGYTNDFIIGEDYDLLLRLGLKGNMSISDQVCTKYRVHGQNISKQKRRIALRDNLDILTKYKDQYPNFTKAYIRRKSRLIIGIILAKYL